MYINIQQNQVSKSAKTVHTNLFAKYRKLHKLATTNSNLEKSNFSDMHHRMTYMYINFHLNRVSTSIKTVDTNLLQKIASCISLQLPIVIVKKGIVSDMHHSKKYMYINF